MECGWILGVPSRRKLTMIPRRNTLLWLTLALSTLPLHLVEDLFARSGLYNANIPQRYNSTAFVTLSAYNYTSGFSPVAIVTVTSVSVGLIMLAYLIGMPFRKFNPGIPVAGSNSLAMSAACHRCHLVDGSRGGILSGASAMEMGSCALCERASRWHCTFSCDEVETPRDGFIYR